VARNVSETTPIKWGQSLAIALVLLVISAHLGMWSRRQRLAAEGPRTDGGKRISRKKARRANATVTETSALAEPVADGTSNLSRDASATEGAGRLSGGSNATDVGDTDATDVFDAVKADAGAPEDADSRRPGGRTYRGRRRRP
jgi:hypothetical protein